MKAGDLVLLERLNENPKLRHRMEELLNIVENTRSDCRTANETEAYVIEELIISQNYKKGLNLG